MIGPCLEAVWRKSRNVLIGLCCACDGGNDDQTLALAVDGDEVNVDGSEQTKLLV